MQIGANMKDFDENEEMVDIGDEEEDEGSEIYEHEDEIKEMISDMTEEEF